MRGGIKDLTKVVLLTFNSRLARSLHACASLGAVFCNPLGQGSSQKVRALAQPLRDYWLTI